MQYVRAIIDPHCSNGAHGKVIEEKLKEIQISMEVKTQPIEGLITFQRSTTQQRIIRSQNNEAVVSDSFTQENKILYLMLGDEFVKVVNAGKLSQRIVDIQNKYPKNTVILLIYGMKSYCRSNRGCVGIRETETALTEIQLLRNCCHKHHETPEELATTIAQYAKAIAEIPYKLQSTSMFNQEQVYLGNEKKDCIRIQDNGLGLTRLWQQQLLKMPLVTLEVAEAIIKEYPSPTTLISAYNDSHRDGPNLLAHIPIRRHGGVLQTARKIGPEMSRKMYEYFSSMDPQKLIE